MNQNMLENMIQIMNPNELKNYTDLLVMISIYSEDLTAESKQDILNRVIKISGQNIQMSELDSYWKSCSDEEFCIQLALEKVAVGTLNEAEIIAAVKNIYEEKNIGRLDMLINKFGDSIEYHFKKPEGSLYDLIFAEPDGSFIDVILTLRKNDVIQL